MIVEKQKSRFPGNRASETMEYFSNPIWYICLQHDMIIVGMIWFFSDEICLLSDPRMKRPERGGIHESICNR